MRQAITRALMLSALILTTGACSNPGLQEAAQPPLLAHLSDAMQQCLAGQADSRKQLAGQSRQLQEVAAALEAVRQAQIDPAKPEHPPTTAAPAPSCPPAEAAPPQGKITVGRRERIWVQDLQLALKARIDTGAETASLDARNIEQFERNSKKWVRFEILHPETDEPIKVERKLVRRALIVQSNNAEAERRPVIKLGISIGELSQSAEFTLSDRGHLDYQILVGRNILKDVMLVDVSKEYLLPLPEEAKASNTKKERQK